MAQQISTERKTIYYVGMALMIVGGLLFASTFVMFATHSGDPLGIHKEMGASIVRAFAGVALLVVGGFVRGLGARGLAGSGIVLDPEQARQDLEPYSRMAGGMVKDALHEADVAPSVQPKQVIMIKCRSCATLNTEDSKFCRACGKQL